MLSKMNKNQHIYVFDVDDTLIDTKACVRAVDAYGNVIFRAGTQTFNAPDSTARLLSPNLRWDFSEFESLEQIISEPTRKPFEILKELVAARKKVFICTCRQNRHMLWKWLHLNGIKIPIERIMCYNQAEGLCPADWKAYHITKVAHDLNNATGWSSPAIVHLYEDDANFKEAIFEDLALAQIEYVDEPIN